MVKLKFINLLNLLSEAEIKGFYFYINSNNFSRRGIYQKIIEKYSLAKKTGLEKFTTKSFMEMITEATGMKKQSFWNRLSELNSIIEDFLIFTEIKTLSGKKSLELLRIYHKRNAISLFEQEYGKYYSHFDKTPYESENLANYKEATFLNSLNKFKKKRFSEFVSEYTRYAELIIYDFLQSVYTSSVELIQQSEYKKDHSSKLINRITDIINPEKLFKDINDKNGRLQNFINILYEMMKAYKLKDDRHYLKAKGLFETNKKHLGNKVSETLYFIFITHCINMTNLGNSKYFYELFELVNMKLNDGYINDLKTINYPVNNFRDYVIIAMRTNNLKWAEDFIEKYSKYIPSDVRESEVNICKGMVLYRRKKLQQSLDLLNSVIPKNFLHYSDIAIHRLFILYDNEQIVESYEQVKKFRQYLRTHPEIPLTFQKAYDLFLKEYSKMLSCVSNSNRQEAEFLLENLKKLPYNTRRNWIIERLEKFLQK